MSSYIRLIYDRLDFLEFKQNILLLKPPQHKASIFFDLTIEDFMKIKDYTKAFEDRVKSEKHLDLATYEKGLFEIWPGAKSYPSSSVLIAKSLMDKDSLDALVIL